MANATLLLKLARNTTIAVLAAGCFFGSSGMARADDFGGSNVGFAGADAREKTWYGYMGVIHHFDPNLQDDSALFRVFGTYGKYRYSTNAVAGGEVKADFGTADVMAGYQKGLQGFVLRGYAGLEFEDHDLSPDNTLDSNRGSDVGVKVQGEFETDYSSPYYANLIASYGTAKERYWTRLRAGYDFSNVVVGPEGLLTGDKEHDEQRVGAFILLKDLGPVSLSLSTGYSDSNDRRGGSSPYATIEVSTSF